MNLSHADVGSDLSKVEWEAIGTHVVSAPSAAGDLVRKQDLDASAALGMLKATYDADNDGIVDKAEAIDDGGGHTASATDLASAVSLKHTRAHLINSTSDHTGILGTEDNIVTLDANGLPQDSGVAIGTAADDKKAKVSGDDTTANYLESKVVAGSGVTATVVSPAGNETLAISAPLVVDQDTFGFTSWTTTSISFSDSTYVFTLTDAGSGWSYYRSGVKCTISGTKTVCITATPETPPTAGIYYIYIDSTIGTLVSSGSSWTLDVGDTKVPVATIKWNNACTPKYHLMDERHSCRISRRTHWYEHLTEGVKQITSGALDGPAVSTASDAGVCFGFDPQVLADEDIKISIGAFTKPVGTTTVYPLFYRTAASTWVWEKSAVPFRYTTSGYIQYDNAGTMTEGAHNKHYNTYLVFGNISGDYAWFLIHGRSEFTTAAAAYAENVTSFTFTGLDIREALFAYQFTWSTSSSHTHKGKCTLARTPVKIQVSVAAASMPTTANHNALSGLQGGTTGEYYHLTAAQTALVGDGKAKVSSNDTTAGYLNGKLVAGTNITLTEGTDGGNETLTIAATGGGGGDLSRVTGTTSFYIDADSANSRGENAVDLQTARTAATQVASGNEGSALVGGAGSTASGLGAVVVAGSSSDATGAYSAVVGGVDNLASGTHSISTGFGNTASGNYSTALGGQATTASGSHGSVLGGHTVANAGVRSGAISCYNSGLGATATNCVILGGNTNTIYGGTDNAVIAGYGNTINLDTYRNNIMGYSCSVGAYGIDHCVSGVMAAPQNDASGAYYTLCRAQHVHASSHHETDAGSSQIEEFTLAGITNATYRDTILKPGTAAANATGTSWRIMEGCHQHWLIYVIAATDTVTNVWALNAVWHRDSSGALTMLYPASGAGITPNIVDGLAGLTIDFAPYTVSSGPPIEDHVLITAHQGATATGEWRWTMSVRSTNLLSVTTGGASA